MEQIKSNPILKFNDNQLQTVRKEYGYEDVNKLKQDIKNLEDWIEKQNHFTVKKFDQEYLERLLIYNKGSIERTKQKLDKLCTFVNLMPDFLRNFDIKNEFRHLFNIVHTCVLPRPTDDNYRVLISRNTGGDDNDYEVIQYFRYFMVLGQYMLNNDYCLGYEMIADTRQMPMSLVAKLSPVVIHKGFLLFVETMGQRIKKIHLISGSKVLDTLLIIAKQSLSAKLKQRIVVHSNVESLYEHIPREQLPEDFGGDEKSIKELSERNLKELSSDRHISTMKFMEIMGTNESRRLVSKFNEEYSGMPGSFKTLCVD